MPSPMIIGDVLETIVTSLSRHLKCFYEGLNTSLFFRLQGQVVIKLFTIKVLFYWYFYLYIYHDFFHKDKKLAQLVFSIL